VFPAQLTTRAAAPFHLRAGPARQFLPPVASRARDRAGVALGAISDSASMPRPLPRGPARQGASSGYLLRPRSRTALTQNPSSTSAAASTLTLAGRRA
jgi:hypothetical protein